MNVLIVCDNLEICNFIRNSLCEKYSDIQFEHITDTIEAYKRILKNHFDVLIVDSNISGKLGPEALINAAHNVGKRSIYISDKWSLLYWFNRKLKTSCKIVDLVDLSSSKKFQICCDKLLQQPTEDVHQMTSQLLQAL